MGRKRRGEFVDLDSSATQPRLRRRFAVHAVARVVVVRLNRVGVVATPELRFHPCEERAHTGDRDRRPPPKETATLVGRDPEQGGGGGLIVGEVMNLTKATHHRCGTFRVTYVSVHVVLRCSAVAASETAGFEVRTFWDECEIPGQRFAISRVHCRISFAAVNPLMFSPRRSPQTYHALP